MIILKSFFCDEMLLLSRLQSKQNLAEAMNVRPSDVLVMELFHGTRTNEPSKVILHGCVGVCHSLYQY